VRKQKAASVAYIKVKRLLVGYCYPPRVAITVYDILFSSLGLNYDVIALISIRSSDSSHYFAHGSCLLLGLFAIIILCIQTCITVTRSKKLLNSEVKCSFCVHITAKRL